MTNPTRTISASRHGSDRLRAFALILVAIVAVLLGTHSVGATEIPVTNYFVANHLLQHIQSSKKPVSGSGAMISTQIVMAKDGPWIGVSLSKSGMSEVNGLHLFTTYPKWVQKGNGLVVPAEALHIDGLKGTPEVRFLHPVGDAEYADFLGAYRQQMSAAGSVEHAAIQQTFEGTRVCAEMNCGANLKKAGIPNEDLLGHPLAFEKGTKFADEFRLVGNDPELLRARLRIAGMAEPDIDRIVPQVRRYCQNCQAGLDRGAIPHGPRKRCFARGTPVHTDHGAVAIEELHEGDLVWSIDESTFERSLQPVVHTFANPPAETVVVHFEGTTPAADVVSTPNHPYLTTARGWVAASALTAGDVLLLASGRLASVHGVTFTGQVEPVFNVEVANTHAYFVGTLAVAVHNDSAPKVNAFPASYQHHDFELAQEMGESSATERNAGSAARQLAGIPSSLGRGPRAQLMRLAYIGMFANRELGRAAASARPRGAFFDICGQGKDFVDQACMHLNDLRNPFRAANPREFGKGLLFDAAMWAGEALANKLDEHLVKQNDIVRRAQITAGLEPLRGVLERNGLQLQ